VEQLRRNKYIALLENIRVLRGNQPTHQPIKVSSKSM
jgi:hypothetical protein